MQGRARLDRGSRCRMCVRVVVGSVKIQHIYYVYIIMTAALVYITRLADTEIHDEDAP